MSTATVGRMKKKGEPGKGPVEYRNLTVRATTDWLAWVERGAASCRMNMATAVDIALTEYFAAQGFEEPPPPRY